MVPSRSLVLLFSLWVSDSYRCKTRHESTSAKRARAPTETAGLLLCTLPCPRRLLLVRDRALSPSNSVCHTLRPVHCRRSQQVTRAMTRATRQRPRVRRILPRTHHRRPISRVQTVTTATTLLLFVKTHLGVKGSRPRWHARCRHRRLFHAHRRHARCRPTHLRRRCLLVPLH